jgi:hypothetical protein
MITIKKGNPYNATLTFTDADGNAYPLTGKTVFFTVKYKDDTGDDDTNAVITADITDHTNASGGITALALDADDTDIAPGDYKYDIRVYDADPLVQINSTSGICTVVDIVTKRVS